MAVIKPSVKRSPIWPALLSALLVPGAGQLYNQEVPKGLLLMSGFFGAILWFSKVVTAHLVNALPGTPDEWVKNQAAFYAAVMALVQERASMFMTFQLLILVLWAYGVIDAYVTAKAIAKRTAESTTSENDIV